MTASFEALSVKICRGYDLYACLKNKNKWRIKVTECSISPICLEEAIEWIVTKIGVYRVDRGPNHLSQIYFGNSLNAFDSVGVKIIYWLAVSLLTQCCATVLSVMRMCVALLINWILIDLFTRALSLPWRFIVVVGYRTRTRSRRAVCVYLEDNLWS